MESYKMWGNKMKGKVANVNRRVMRKEEEIDRKIQLNAL
jgi:hypothetical protein